MTLVYSSGHLLGRLTADGQSVILLNGSLVDVGIVSRTHGTLSFRVIDNKLSVIEWIGAVLAGIKTFLPFLAAILTIMLIQFVEPLTDLVMGMS